MPLDTTHTPLLAQAQTYANERAVGGRIGSRQYDQLPGLAILAVAEAIHRLAAAAERLVERQDR